MANRIKEKQKGKPMDDAVRSEMAVLFAKGFIFFLMAAILIGAVSIFVTSDTSFQKVKELILTISGTFFGPLGIAD